MAAVIGIQTVLNSPRNINAVIKKMQSELSRVGINFTPDQKLLTDLRKFKIALQSIKLDKSLTADFNRSIRAMSELNREQERARTLSQELGQQTAITAKRFSVYLIASRALSGFGSTLRTATGDAIKFDRELLKVRQTLTKLGNEVNQLSGAQFGALETTINRTATSFGVAGDELVRASQFFAQAGRNIGEIQTLVSALGRASLTPTFSNVEKSAENLEALLTQFNLRADQGAAVLDKLNNVAKNFNVQVSELFTGIEKSGAAFAASGGAFDRALGDPRNLRNLEEFIALYTSVISTSRESADVVGTAFKTIIPRLQRTKTQDVLKNQLNIDTFDAEGNFRGVLTIVQEIDKALKSGGTSTQNRQFAQLVEVLGGQRQYSRIIPLLTQVAKAQEALNAAQNASGSIAQDVELAQENLAVQISQLREEFALLIRDLTKTGTFQTFAKTLLELARSAITLTAAIEPLIPLLTTLAAIRIGSGLFAFGRGFNQKFSPGRSAINIPGLNRGGFAKGGSIRSVMLTPGEGVLTPAQVKRYPGGSPALERLNRFGTGSAPAAMSIVPGTGNTDTVPANLPEGSFVIRKAVTQSLLRKRLSQRLNKGGRVGFATGGEIPGFGEIAKELRRNIRGISNLRGLGLTTGEISRIVNDLKAIDFSSFRDFSRFLQDMKTRLLRASEQEIARLRGGLANSPGARAGDLGRFSRPGLVPIQSRSGYQPVGQDLSLLMKRIALSIDNMSRVIIARGPAQQALPAPFVSNIVPYSPPNAYRDAINTIRGFDPNIIEGTVVPRRPNVLVTPRERQLLLQGPQAFDYSDILKEPSTSRFTRSSYQPPPDGPSRLERLRGRYANFRSGAGNFAGQIRQGISSGLSTYVKNNRTGIGLGLLGATAVASQQTSGPGGAALLGAATGGGLGFQFGGPYGAAIGAVAGGLVALKTAADDLEKKRSIEKIADQLNQLGNATDLKGLIREFKLSGGPTDILDANLKRPGLNAGAFSGAFFSKQTLFSNLFGLPVLGKGLASTTRFGRRQSGGAFSDSLFEDAVSNSLANIQSKENASLSERQSLLSDAFSQARGNVGTSLQARFTRIAGLSGSVSEEQAAAEARKIARQSPELARLFGQFAENVAPDATPEQLRDIGERELINLGRQLGESANETIKLNQELAKYSTIARSLRSDIDGLNDATEGISQGLEIFSRKVSRTVLRGTGSTDIGDLGLQNRFQNFRRLSDADLGFAGDNTNLFDRTRNAAVAGERLRRSFPTILSSLSQNFGEEPAAALTEAIANSEALKGAPQVIVDAIQKNIEGQGDFSLVDVFGDPDKFLSSLDTEFRGAQDAIRSFYDVVNAQTQSIAAAIDQRVQLEQENNRKLGSLLETAATLRDFQIGARGGNPLEGRNALQELSDAANTARLGRISVGGPAPNVAAIFNRNQELEQRRNQLLTQFQSVTSAGGDTTRITDELQRNSSELARNKAAMEVLSNATNKLSVVNSQLAEIQQRREASRSLLTDLFDPDARRQLAVNNAATSAILGGNIDQLSDKTIRDALQFVFSDAAKLQLEKTGGLQRLGFDSIETLRAKIATAAGENLKERGILGGATDIRNLVGFAGTRQNTTNRELELNAQVETIAKIQKDVLQAQFALGNAALREVGDQIRQQQDAFSKQLREVFQSDDAASMRDAFNRLSDTLANGSQIDLRITEAEINVNIANAEGIAKALGRDLDGPLRRMIKQSIQEFFN